MSRGGSYGGGQSSLGYLFGNEKDKPTENSPPPPPPRTVQAPPYGTDTSSEQNPGNEKENVSGRAKPQRLGNFLTDRPSTKVKSVPGGDSSLGYLFGDK